MLNVYNTLSRKKEIFKPIRKEEVGLYTCGPTVYWFAHLGNLRAYIFEDILKRVLEYNSYKVKHIMNITDVGHLTSDADTGEDKMEKGARREGKSAWEIAKFYTDAFKKNIKGLNIKEPSIWAKATDHIKEQIDLIRILKNRGFTYKISDGVYFNTSKIKDYGKLVGLKKRKLRAGARIEIVRGKKHPTDFALWKFSPLGIKRQMEWNSPWGKGFPGWHTECVVMAVKYLGIPFDIHTGGIDHIPIHHTNEIAQAEAGFKKPLARFWLHGEFLVLKEGRMGKSEGNIITLEKLIKQSFNPLSYRYLCLNTHYRKQLAFSWQTLEGAESSLNKLYQKVIEIKSGKSNSSVLAKNQNAKKIEEEFLGYINDDLNTPKALALMWKVIKTTKLSNKEKYSLLIRFDKIFGLDIKKIKVQEIPSEVKKLIKEREEYRKKNNYNKADEVRQEIKERGWQVEDTKEGPKIKKL